MKFYSRIICPQKNGYYKFSIYLRPFSLPEVMAKGTASTSFNFLHNHFLFIESIGIIQAGADTRFTFKHVISQHNCSFILILF